MRNRNYNAGFTLAELLIALVILGVIATFTIPKVLQNDADNKKDAIFKETISALYAVVRSANYSQPSGSGYDYYSNNLNHVVGCPSDASAEGCGAVGPGSTNPGLLLHNGAVILDINQPIDGSNWGEDNITIDWNGSEGPNTVGDDQLYAVIIYMRPAPNNTHCTNERPYTILPGECSGGSYNPLASSVALYESIFD